MMKRRRTEQDEMLVGRVPPGAPAAPPLPGPSPAARQRRRRRRGSFLRQIGAVAAILIAVYVALPFLLSASRMRSAVEEKLSQNLGRRVRIGSLRFSATFGALIASDVSIADDPAFSSAPCFHALRMDLSVRRIPLILRRAVELTGVSIEDPTVTLIRSGQQWNFHTILAAGSPAGDTSPGPGLKVRRGIMVVRASDRHDPVVLRDIDLEAPRISTVIANAFALTATVGGGGALKINGNWGPVEWRGRIPSVPMSLLVNARKVAIAESNLLAELADAVGGLWSMDGTIESDGARLQVKGNGELDKVRLSANGSPTTEPLNLAFALEHDFATHTGTLSRFDLTLLKGGASIEGTYTLADEGAILKLKAQAQGAPVTLLSGLLPAAGVPLPPGTTLQGGLAFIELEIEGNLKGPTTTGTVTLNNTKLMSFDLEDRLSSVDGLDMLHISRDLPIDSWRSIVQITPERLAVSGLEVVVPEIGLFAGQGAIDVNRTLDFQMSAVRHGVADKRPIPFVVRGACIAPIFRQPGKA
jgi:AsmA protein